MFINRKVHLFLTLALLIVLLFVSACSSSGKNSAASSSPSISPASTTTTSETAAPVNEKKYVIKYDPQGHMPKEPTAKDPTKKDALTILNKQYEALHPNVKIELVDVPGNTDRVAWVQARMMAKDAPDVFFQDFGDANLNYQKGWFLPFDDYLSKPTPYNDNKIWGDTFIPGLLDSMRAADKKIYVTPVDGVGVGIFYNKKIFSDLKLEVPKTWAEFMNVLQKIKDSGTTPFIFNDVSKGCCDVAWTEALLHNQFWTGNTALIAEVDENKDGVVTTLELANATKKGILPKMDILEQELKLYKDFSQFFPRGFAAKFDELQMFTTGKGAMMFGGSWTFNQLDASKLPFEYGTFNFPVVTKESASLSTEKGAKIYGPWGPGQWAIPGYLQKDDPDKIPVIMDYLMFLSKPENISLMTSQSGSEPNIIGATPQKGHDVFLVDLPLIEVQHYNGFFDNTFSDQYEQSLTYYLTGKEDLPKFLSEVKSYYSPAADRVIKQFETSQK